MAKKVTMKEKVLQYVEQRGSARYTDIIKFIVDTKFGAGTYDLAKGTDEVCGKYITETKSWKKYKANPYRGYYSGAFAPHYEFSIDNRRKRTGYFLKGADRLEKRDTLYYTVRTATPKVHKTVQPKVQREYPRFSTKTLKVIEDLQMVLKRNIYTGFKSQAALLKEIEGLKFPHLKKYQFWQNDTGNLYMGKQYKSILNLCIKLGWIKIERKDNHRYKVNVLTKVYDTLPNELRISTVYKSDTSDSNPTISKLDKLDEVLKTVLNKTQPNVKTSSTKTFEKTNDLNVNIALDPSLNWIVKTINGISYLSISN